MINLNKKEAERAIKHEAEQKTAFICYICGKHHTEEVELCSACAGIISKSLKLICVKKSVDYAKYIF